MQISSMRNEKGVITTNLTLKDIQNDYEYIHCSKFDNLNEMDKFLERYKLPKQTQEDTGILSISVFIF